MNHFEICFFTVAADIVGLTDSPFPEDQVNAPAMVFHVEPVSDIEAIAINGQGFAGETIENKEGNEFFRVLVWPVIV